MAKRAGVCRGLSIFQSSVMIRFFLGSVAFYFASHGHVQGSKLEGSLSGKNSDGTVVEDNEIYGSGADGITLHAGG
ncbi:MAG: hypothetical protein KAI47_11600 [Deltaproteobacteria bacterium]|nr:hypothetical protein [Deltaproteobacteria bacterium]